METITFKESGAQTDSTTGTSFSLQNDYDSATFILDVTALATATGDKLDVFIDVSPDGVTWVNAVHFTQLDGDGSAVTLVAKMTDDALNDPDATLDVTSDAAESVVRNVGLMPHIRYRSTITDVTTDDASFTYSLVGIFH